MFFNLCTSLVKLFHQENNFIDKPRHQELKILETVLALSGHDLLLTKHFLMNNGRKKKKQTQEKTVNPIIRPSIFLTT